MNFEPVSGAADFALENLGEPNLALKHLIEVEAVHTDDAFAAPESGETVILKPQLLENRLRVHDLCDVSHDMNQETDIAR